MRGREREGRLREGGGGAENEEVGGGGEERGWWRERDCGSGGSKHKRVKATAAHVVNVVPVINSYTASC